MATIISKRGAAEARAIVETMWTRGLDIKMCGTTISIAQGHAYLCTISEMRGKSRQLCNVGLITILRDPYDLIPLADGAMVQDVGRYIDNCAPGSMLPADALRLADPANNPIARFFRAQLAIHTSELALVFPREIMRVGLIGNNYYIAQVPLPRTAIIAREIAGRTRLRMTSYVVRISRAYYVTHNQVEKAARELFADSAQPADFDATIPPRTRRAAVATPAITLDSDSDEDEDAPIVAKEYKEYDG